VLSVLSVVTSPPPASAASPPPRVAVDAGWNGRARAGCFLPVRVTVTGLTEPLEGRIEVELSDVQPGTPMSRGEAVTSRSAVPVSLVPGGAKQFTLYLVPRSTYISASLPLPVNARLRHGRQVVATGKGSLRLLPIGTRLLVTATGEPAGLQGWDGRPRRNLGWAEPEIQEDPNFAEPVLRVAHVLPAALPERWNGYDAADLVVVTGAAWVRMTGRQRRALRLWVEGGGRAILCGEQAGDWRDPEARSLVPGTLRDATVSRGAWRLALGAWHQGSLRDESTRGEAAPRAESREPGARSASGASLAAALIEPRGEARPFLRAGRAVLGCTAPAGFGAVLWLGTDPFRSGTTPDRQVLWRNLIARATAAPVRPSRLGSLSDSPTATSLAGTLPRLPAPSRGLLVGIALAYVLVFGPLNIRVLRTLSRGVTAWLFLPALSLVMTLVLLAIGRSWGQSRAMLNRVSVVEAMSGAATGREQGLNGLFSPANAVYTVEMGDPAVLLQLAGQASIDAEFGGAAGPTAGPGYGGPPGGPGYGPPGIATGIPAVDPSRPEMRSGALPTLQLEESCRWEELPLALWTLQNQSYERLADLGGAVTLSLTRRPGELPAGTVHNSTSLRLARAYLHFEGHRLPLGDLEPEAVRRVAASGWQRRRMAMAPVPSTGSRPPAGTNPSPGTDGDVQEPMAPATLYEEAIVLLRPGTRGAADAPLSEALLVAETAGLIAPMSVAGVTVFPRATLLLVRAPVRE